MIFSFLYAAYGTNNTCGKSVVFSQICLTLCWESVTFWCGSGFGSYYFFSDFKDAQKIIFFRIVFLELARRHIIFSLKN
jgi:hypothetical protein